MSTSLSSIKPGHVMAFINWVEVKEVLANSIIVTDLNSKQEIEVRGKSLVETGLSADAFSKVEKVTKTQIAEKLTECKNTPLTVCYITAEGKERVLRGKWTSQEPLMGRSYVIDLDIKKGSPLRLVCHRNIKWLITENVQYVVKK